MAATYEPIASTTLGTAGATVTFSDIPGTYTDLVLVCHMTNSTSGGYGYIRFNGDGGTNYSSTRIEGTGSSAQSSRLSDTSTNYFNSNTLVSNTDPSTHVFHIMSYANTNVFKTYLHAGADFASGAAGVARRVALWRSTNAITSLSITSNVNYTAGSTFSLFGVKAA